eukprot:TRINITY_DN5399_c0_g2_i3.p1 TRINITY_DN5399_c0_g2~~TRINITY_DN5399_c0_g2_i3.p1  ORF type:complete len:1960 (+),score=510.81 TRINITY_DN5399_c0_g2_i3:78-5957(+)
MPWNNNWNNSQNSQNQWKPGNDWQNKQQGGNNWKQGADWKNSKPNQGQPTTVPPKVIPGTTGGGVPPAAANIGGTHLRVGTQSKKSDAVVQTLIGDYTEQGSNHGRKYYKKQGVVAGNQTVSVFLYYWDTRDGADFSGWWFGDQVGGSQVWAKASDSSQTPPKAGWRVPWDSATVDPGALVVELTAAVPQKPAVASASSVATASGSTTGASAMVLKGHVKKATEQVTELEASTRHALANAKKMTDLPEPAEGDVKKAVEMLSTQQTKLNGARQSLRKVIGEAKKGGASVANFVSEFKKLSARIKILQTSVAVEVRKASGEPELEPGAFDSDEEPKESVGDAQRKNETESHSAEAFAKVLEAVQATVSSVEASVEGLSSSSESLLAKAPEESDSLQESLSEIEAGAVEAQAKLGDARTELNGKLADAKKLPHEVRKEALNDLSKLQTKLAEAQKMLNPFKSFKRDFADRVAARRSLAEVAIKFDDAEFEIVKAENMCQAAEIGQMIEDQVTEVDEHTKLAQSSLQAAQQLLAQRARGGDNAMYMELEKLKSRGTELRGKLVAITTKVRSQREGLQAEGFISMAKERVEMVEEGLTKCQSAEMPFLKGIEVLPQEQSDKAIAESEAASLEAASAVNQAKSFVKMKQGEVKRFVQDVSGPCLEQLKNFLQRIEAAEGKLNSFRQDTAERKMAAVFSDVIDTISAAEKKAAVLSELGKALSPEALETSTLESLQEAIEKAMESEKTASTFCTEAKKLVQLKQRESKGRDAMATLTKINGRLATAQDKVMKQRQAISLAQKFIQTTEILAQEGAHMKEAESLVQSATEASTPKEGEELADESVQAMDVALRSAVKILRALPSAIQPCLAAAPAATKAALHKILDRRREAQEKIDKIRAATKDQFEKVMSVAYLKEVEGLFENIEAAIEGMNEAELPFLKGIEVLPLKESKATVEASEKAACKAQESISEARNFIAARSLETRSWGAEPAKVITEGFAKMTERVNTSAQTVSVFKKDTDGRKKTSQIQEGGAFVKEVEAEVQKVVEAGAPFMKEDASSMSEEEAAAPLEAFLAVEKSASARIVEVRSFLSERLRASKDSPSQLEAVKKLEAKLAEAAAELSKVKKTTSEHEQRFMARRFLADVNEQLETLDGVIKVATSVCAPLLEHAGEMFLVATSVRTLTHALREHVREKELTLDQLFEDVGKDYATFAKYLKELPEAIGHEELSAFTEERTAAIFKVMDADKDGTISKADFDAFFRTRCKCVKGITVTDSFDISAGKTLGKVEAGEAVEIFGAFKMDEAGMLRSECNVASLEQTGWITLKGNTGTFYVEPVLPFNEFCGTMDKAIGEATGNINKVSSFLTAKAKEGGTAAPGGPLAEARAEMIKSRSQVSEALSKLDALRKQVVVAKRELITKEKAELNAHIENREKKESLALTSVVDSEVTAAEAAAAAVIELCEAFVAVELPESFETPATVLDASQKLLKTAETTAVAAQAKLKEQLAVVQNVKPQTRPVVEAKRTLQKMQGKVETDVRKAKMTVESIRTKCQSVVDHVFNTAAKTLRDEMKARSMSGDTLFDELAKGADCITDDNFCDKLKSLEGVVVNQEHLKLLCRSLETGGITRGRFLGFVQLFYVVVKEIAITDLADVSTCKTIRKAERDELVEVLEGPTDEGSGLARARVRSICDGVEGWITVKGNQGTPFLQEAAKPFYAMQREVQMDKEFKPDGEVVRSLKGEEIVELVEGPRKGVVLAALRAKVKVASDGASGWVSIRGRDETVYAEVNAKLLHCTQSVAMTDNKDMASCKVLRKLAVGELFEAFGEAVEDSDSGVWRVEGRAMKDSKTGWIATKGNAGTTFMEAANKFYSVVKQVDLHKKFPSGDDAEVVRTLSEGESFQVIEGPREETSAPEVRVKVRAVTDSACGWIDQKEQNIRCWTLRYSLGDAVVDERSEPEDKPLVEGEGSVEG